MSSQTLAPSKTKAQSLRSTDVADFPVLTGLEEEWRFTPLKRLRGLATGAPEMTAQLRLEAEGMPSGVSVSMVERGEDDRIGSVLIPFDRVSALAYGGAPGAALIEVAAGTVVPEPAVVRVV